MDWRSKIGLTDAGQGGDLDLVRGINSTELRVQENEQGALAGGNHPSEIPWNAIKLFS